MMAVVVQDEGGDMSASEEEVGSRGGSRGGSSASAPLCQVLSDGGLSPSYNDNHNTSPVWRLGVHLDHLGI
jgi:hypothetical protein